MSVAGFQPRPEGEPLSEAVCVSSECLAKFDRLVVSYSVTAVLAALECERDEKVRR